MKKYFTLLLTGLTLTGFAQAKPVSDQPSTQGYVVVCQHTSAGLMCWVV